MESEPQNSKTERFLSSQNVLQGSEFASNSTLHIECFTWYCPNEVSPMISNLRVMQSFVIKLLVPLIE